MTPLALALVLIAAVLHATWNYWAKKAGGGLPFVYLVGLMINLAYLPVVTGYVLWREPTLSGAALGAIFVSGVLKTLYSLFLQRGYRTGDFSLIYPLARGTGPLFSAVGAILILGERPSPVGLAGAAAIIAGIFLIAGGHRWVRSLWGAAPRQTAPAAVGSIPTDAASTPSLVGGVPPPRTGGSDLQTGPRGTRREGTPPTPDPIRQAAGYGFVSVLFIAAYTLWDKQGVAHLMIAPVLYDAGTALTQLVLLAPFAWRRRGEVAKEWRLHRRNAVIVAALSPLSYVLVLTAMTFTPVSYVAPAREVSILIGMAFGAHFLNEAEARRRLWAGLCIVAGIVALALG